MEHDDELKIREKINGLEAAPIAWDKSLVWTSIRFHGTRPSRRLIVYYAAASLILAAALVFFSVERTRQEELRIRIGEIDLALQRGMLSQTATASITVQSEVPCQQREEEPLKKTMVARHKSNTKTLRTAEADSKTNIPVPVTFADAPVENTTERKAESAMITSDSQPVNQAVVTNPTPVPVILGKSVVAASPGQRSSRGRLSLRLFRGEDDKPVTSGTATPIVTLAGINN